MGAQERVAQAAQAQAPPLKTHGIEAAETPEVENRDSGVRELENCEAKVGECETRELETQEPEEPDRETERQEAESDMLDTTCDGTACGTENHKRETHGGAIHKVPACVSDAPIRQHSAVAQKEDTQLVAIRELMMRSFAAGIWLSLSEIAGATEFGEASISAQLRHLRKAHHGRYRVEKRRRRPGRATAAKRECIRDAEKAPIVWEYRVRPPA